MTPILCAVAIFVATASLSFAQATRAPIESSREHVVRLVVQIQRADYEGDRAALRRLYHELAPLTGGKGLEARVRYWRGFALWRRALNGFNDSVERSELEQDLTQAVSEFDAAAVSDPAFVDAKVGAGSCLFNLVFLYQNDARRLREFLGRALTLLKEAETAEPTNPRLLWVLGANRWYNPPERGGGQALAIDTYERGLKAARENKSAVSDPLAPSWGEPELLMNLAWSNLNRSVPDLDAAERYARSALALIPYWHYCSDILLPQIAASRNRR
jgi:tetratricopeptide (TPR) repeat protein